MKTKLWSGRFSKPTHPQVDEYTASIMVDQTLVMEDIVGSLAHAAMLAKVKIIDEQEQQLIHRGLEQIAKKIKANEVEFNLVDEDVHMNIERLLHAEIGEVAGKLHTARSRNDQVALDVHLYLRKQIILIIELLIKLQKVLLKLAREHLTIIMPGYTHLQRAQPIYLSQYWLAYVAMFARDVTRLKENFARANQSPLGAAALTGTTFAVDRNHVAHTLGFDGIYLNTLDAVSDRDFIIEFIASASLIMMHISRLSEELIIWSSQEFNFISFDDAFSTGSSIMPQKKNPDVAELGRGKCARVYGALMTVLTLLKGLPLAYNKDMQEDKEPLFDTVDTLQQTLSIYPSLLSTLTIHQEKMHEAVKEGYLNATALAEYLVKCGMSFRIAHETVGKMVAHCVNKKCRLEELTLAEMQAFFPGFSEEIYTVLDLEAIAKICNTDQQTGQSLVEMALLEHAKVLNNCEEWMAGKKVQIEGYVNNSILSQCRKFTCRKVTS